MDIGKLDMDKTYYDGYEGESEVIISLPTKEYHFWEGYFEDIFDTSDLSDVEWKGFTRDYNECTCTFSDDNIECAIMPKEYLDDLKLYVNHTFEYEETKDVLEKLLNIFEEAYAKDICVLVRVN